MLAKLVRSRRPLSKRSRKIRAAAITAVVTATAAVALNRRYRQKDDYVPNPDNSDFRKYLEEQRKLGNEIAKPWVTTDAKVLEQLSYTQEIVIPDMRTTQLLTKKVVLKPLSQCPHKNDETIEFVGKLVVGGTPAAMVAMQTAIDGNPGLYVNYTKDAIAISDGSALHGEPQRLSDGPAYESGSTPLKFMWDEIKAFISPPRYSQEVVQPNLRWKKLGWGEWIMRPTQWLEGIRVAVGNQSLAWRYEKAVKEGASTGTENFTKGIQGSGEAIKKLDQYLGGGIIIQKERDSLWVTRSDADEKGAQQDAETFKKEGCEYVKLTEEEVKKEFGFVPRNAKGYWKKVGDFSFRKDFMKHLTKAIEDHGYEVRNDWQLREVYTDSNKPGGIAVFVESTSNGEKTHIRRFASVFLSLGAATYTKAPAPLATVAGMSCQGIISGVELKAGKSLVFGDTNHVTPLSDTKDGPLNEKTGKPERITPVQYTNSARVRPRDMGDKWADFDIKYALHLDESLRTTLPESAKYTPVFCRACPRELGPEGILTWHKIAPDAYVQMGAGGGGLTQGYRGANEILRTPTHGL